MAQIYSGGGEKAGGPLRRSCTNQVKMMVTWARAITVEGLRSDQILDIIWRYRRRLTDRLSVSIRKRSLKNDSKVLG